MRSRPAQCLGGGACAACSADSLQCTGCKAGYGLNSGKQCVPCATAACGNCSADYRCAREGRGAPSHASDPGRAPAGAHGPPSFSNAPRLATLHCRRICTKCATDRRYLAGNQCKLCLADYCGQCKPDGSCQRCLSDGDQGGYVMVAGTCRECGVYQW